MKTFVVKLISWIYSRLWWNNIKLHIYNSNWIQRTRFSKIFWNSN